MTTCPDWANLARAESPTVAFASEQECIDYIDDRGTTVPVEVPTTCPNFASVATSENPTVAFTSEAECVTYIDGGGATVPVEVVVTCPNFASLARTETPTVAFTSEAECIAYIIGGGTTVPVETVVFNPVVALEATGGTTDGKCDVEVSITGFLPNTTYGGNVQTAGGGFGGNVKLGMSIVTDANGAGSMQPGSIAPGMYRAAITVGPGAAEFSNDVSISCDIPDDDGIGVSFSLVVT